MWAKEVTSKNHCTLVASHYYSQFLLDRYLVTDIVMCHRLTGLQYIDHTIATPWVTECFRLSLYETISETPPITMIYHCYSLSCQTLRHSAANHRSCCDSFVWNCYKTKTCFFLPPNETFLYFKKADSVVVSLSSYAVCCCCNNQLQ